MASSIRLLCVAPGSQHLCGNSPHASQQRLHRPVAFGIRKEDFTGTLCLGAVIPALQQRQMTLAEGWSWSLGQFKQRGKCGFHARFQRAASEFHRHISLRGLNFQTSRITNCGRT